MNNDAYLRGFIKQAAAAGVDAVDLAKYVALTKSAYASPFTDMMLGAASDNVLNAIIPGLGNVASSAGYLTGLAGIPDNKKKDTVKAIIPGVGGFRIGNRIKTQVMRELRDIAKSKEGRGARPVAHAVSEHIGPLTSTLASVGIGAGAGALIGGDNNRAEGAITGSIAGASAAAIAHLISSIAAAIRRRRTRDEQIESDKKSLLMKYLVPGIGNYDYLKRLGRSQGEQEESDDGKKDKKEK